MSYRDDAINAARQAGPPPQPRRGPTDEERRAREREIMEGKVRLLCGHLGFEPQKIQYDYTPSGMYQDYDIDRWTQPYLTATFQAPDGLELVAVWRVGAISNSFSAGIKGVPGDVYDKVSFGRALEKMGLQ